MGKGTKQVTAGLKVSVYLFALPWLFASSGGFTDVCINIYGVCEHQIMFPTILLFPSPSKFIFMNVAHEKYSWEAILVSFGEWDAQIADSLCFVAFMCYI